MTDEEFAAEFPPEEIAAIIAEAEELNAICEQVYPPLIKAGLL